MTPTSEERKRPKFNPDQSLARKVLLGEHVGKGTLVTNSEFGATYPFLGWVQIGDGELRSSVMKIGLWRDRSGGWVVDIAGCLGQWCVAENQNIDDYPHLSLLEESKPLNS